MGGNGVAEVFLAMAIVLPLCLLVALAITWVVVAIWPYLLAAAALTLGLVILCAWVTK